MGRATPPRAGGAPYLPLQVYHTSYLGQRRPARRERSRRRRARGALPSSRWRWEDRDEVFRWRYGIPRDDKGTATTTGLSYAPISTTSLAPRHLPSRSTGVRSVVSPSLSRSRLSIAPRPEQKAPNISAPGATTSYQSLVTERPRECPRRGRRCCPRLARCAAPASA
jgi:hypothetical protein